MNKVNCHILVKEENTINWQIPDAKIVNFQSEKVEDKEKDKEESQNNLNKDKPQSSHVQKGEGIKRQWKIVGIIIFAVFLIIIGLSIAIALSVRYKVNTTQSSKKIDLPDGTSVTVTQLQVEKKMLMSPNQQCKVTKTQCFRKVRLLEQKAERTQKFTTIRFNEQGVIVKLSSESNIVVYIDPFNLTNYLMLTFEQPSKIIETSPTNSQQENNLKQQDFSEIQQLLLQCLLQKNKISSVDFSLNNYVKIFLNQTTKQYQIRQKEKHFTPSMQERKKMLSKFYKQTCGLLNQKINFALKIVQKISQDANQIQSNLNGNSFSNFTRINQKESLSSTLLNECIFENGQNLECKRNIFSQQFLQSGQCPPQNYNLQGLITGGNGFLQLGNWRLGLYDPQHFCFTHRSGLTSVIYRSDGRVFHGRRSDFNLWSKSQESLRGVKFLDRCIQFLSTWRICQIDYQHLSISNFAHRTSMIWRVDGTKHSGPRSDFGGFGSSREKPSVDIGQNFIQLGYWRIGQVDSNHLSIGTQTLVADIFRSDGTVHPGPRMDWTMKGQIKKRLR